MSTLSKEVPIVRGVQLCAARCAPFIAHNRPPHTMPLTKALCEKKQPIANCDLSYLKSIAKNRFAAATAAFASETGYIAGEVIPS